MRCMTLLATDAKTAMARLRNDIKENRTWLRVGGHSGRRQAIYKVLTKKGYPCGCLNGMFCAGEVFRVQWFYHLLDGDSCSDG